MIHLELAQALPGNWNQSKTSCFSYVELKAIPICECDEKLVDLSSIENSGIGVGPTPEKLKPYVSHGMWVRESVASRLILAQHFVTEQSPAYQIFVRYGYRHPEVQKKYFEEFHAKSKIDFPHLNDDELLEYVHHYMAIPEVGGHPAGAAIDILLTDRDTGVDVDMGSLIADFTDMNKVVVFSDSITNEQMENRMILRRAMMKAGFAPYDFEWWHFSFGDREWACYYNKSSAIFGEIQFSV